MALCIDRRRYHRSSPSKLISNQTPISASISLLFVVLLVPSLLLLLLLLLALPFFRFFLFHLYGKSFTTHSTTHKHMQIIHTHKQMNWNKVSINSFSKIFWIHFVIFLPKWLNPQLFALVPYIFSFVSNAYRHTQREKKNRTSNSGIFIVYMCILDSTTMENTVHRTAQLKLSQHLFHVKTPLRMYDASKSHTQHQWI